MIFEFDARLQMQIGTLLGKIDETDRVIEEQCDLERVTRLESEIAELRPVSTSSEPNSKKSSRGRLGHWALSKSKECQRPDMSPESLGLVAESAEQRYRNLGGLVRLHLYLCLSHRRRDWPSGREQVNTGCQIFKSECAGFQRLRLA